MLYDVIKSKHFKKCTVHRNMYWPLNASIPRADFTSFRPPYLVPHIIIKPVLCFFKNSSDMGLLPRQILSLPPPPPVWRRSPLVQIRIKFIPSFTDQTYIFLTHRIPVRLSQNCYIWYPAWSIWLSVRGYLAGIHCNMIIIVYPHLFVLSLLSEIVYNVLQKGCN